jgi:hypothetical protein
VWTSIAILILVSGVTIGSVLAASTGSPQVDSTFHLSVIGTTSDNQVDLKSVDCPSAAMCVAVGSFTPSLGGGSGSRSLLLILNALKVESVDVGALGDFNQALSVSCATSVSCVAVGTEDDQGVAWSLADGRWSKRSVAGANTLQSVSCTSRSFCMAAGVTDGGQTSAWRYDGRKWTWMSLGVTPIVGSGPSLQCVSPTFCAADGQEGPYSASLTAPVDPWVSTFDGSVWRTVLLAVHRPIDTGGTLYALACASASHCVAVGSLWSGSSGLLRSTAIDDTWNGARWTDNSTGVFDGLRNVQVIDEAVCSRAECVLTGEYGGTTARHRFQLKLMQGNHVLSTRRVGSGEIDSFAPPSGCAPDGWCLVIVPSDVPNANGPIVYFTNQSVGAERRLAFPNPIVNGLQSLSCSSPRWCMIVGDEPPDTSLHPTVSILVWNGAAIISAYLHSPE